MASPLSIFFASIFEGAVNTLGRVLVAQASVSVAYSPQ